MRLTATINVLLTLVAFICGTTGPVDMMPKTFKDAMSVAILLGVQYIWIDSLYIIQDDENGWKKESSLMGDVYKGALCNFAATAAAESDRSEGLFVETNPLSKSSLAADIKGRLYNCFTETMELSFLLRKELNSRGWILQERLLSPRIVHFSDQSH
jgi:hypothetical protein